ncbi:MAG TPA: hypothetical protein PL143_03445 [Rhodocyclaceae bacterium]|nr:hypothetical protein [Rhodocyclaceae bacterium]
MLLRKMSRFTVVSLMLLGVAVAPLCYAGSHDRQDAAHGDKAMIEDVKRETQELLEALKAYTAEQRDEAVKKTRNALDAMDERIDALETRFAENWATMDEAARERTRAGMKALREQRNRVAEWYGSMKHGTQDAWEDIKQGFSKAYADLQAAWESSRKSEEGAAGDKESK